MTSWMVVFDPTGVLWCFCFTVFSFSVARWRVRFTASACHSCEKLIVKFFSFNERSCSVSKCGCSVDRQGEAEEFSSGLKKVLEQVPLQVNILEMLTHWKWFGEWSIGCVGILSDWVVETAATLCRAGEKVLTLEALTKHALKPAQRLRLETQPRTGEFKIAEAKAKSEEDLQQLLCRPSTVPRRLPHHPPLSNGATTSPRPSKSRASSPIERA